MVLAPWRKEGGEREGRGRGEGRKVTLEKAELEEEAPGWANVLN